MHLKDARVSNSDETGAVSVTQNQYQFVAEVSYIAHNFLVLDLGVTGYNKFRFVPSYAKLGHYVEGEVQISLDDFFLSHTLANISYPPLIHTWRINQIVMEEIPVVFEKNSNGVEVGTYIYSEAKQAIIPYTDALHAGIGISYLLYCTKLDFPVE